MSIFKTAIALQQMGAEDLRARYGKNLRELKHIDGSRWKYLAATDKGNLAGFAGFDPKHEELTQLWVAPEYRRQGVASKLVKKLHPTHLLALASNKKARAFYPALGYEPVATFAGGKSVAFGLKEKDPAWKAALQQAFTKADKAAEVAMQAAATRGASLTTQ